MSVWLLLIVPVVLLATVFVLGFTGCSLSHAPLFYEFSLDWEPPFAVEQLDLLVSVTWGSVEAWVDGVRATTATTPHGPEVQLAVPGGPHTANAYQAEFWETLASAELPTEPPPGPRTNGFAVKAFFPHDGTWTVRLEAESGGLGFSAPSSALPPFDVPSSPAVVHPFFVRPTMPLPTIGQGSLTPAFMHPFLFSFSYDPAILAEQVVHSISLSINGALAPTTIVLSRDATAGLSSGSLGTDHLGRYRSIISGPDESDPTAAQTQTIQYELLVEIPDTPWTVTGTVHFIDGATSSITVPPVVTRFAPRDPTEFDFSIPRHP